MFPAFVTDVCCVDTPPTSSFTEYAGAAVLLSSLGLALTNCIYIYSPNPGIDTSGFSSKHNSNCQGDSIFVSHVYSCLNKCASYPSTSASLGSLSVIRITCKGSGMFFVHAMHSFVNLSKENVFYVWLIFCTKYHFMNFMRWIVKYCLFYSYCETCDFWLQINPIQFPFTVCGPVRTPPIKGYDSPDGEYIDISKKW